MNCTAMHIPKTQLLAELQRCIEQKHAFKEELDARYGTDRIQVSSYMENIGWPGLFGYDMNRWLTDPDFAIEQTLRQQIFWADNVLDDNIPSRWMQADVGMYWDMTLFGAEITHDAIGVPEFHPHLLQQGCDFTKLNAFAFYESGVMPQLIAKYRRMQEIAATDYAGKLEVGFPNFHRGPLDIYVQLRGYENFLDDTMEHPQQLAELLTYLVDERFRFMRERRAFLGEETLPATTFVADDWVNIPFISPAFFRETVVPIYAHIRAQEGPVTGFHTCGDMRGIIPDLLAVFPEMDWLDMSGWNDIRQADALVDPKIRFHASIINTVSLSDATDEQRAKLHAIRDVATHRNVTVCAQAIVKLYPTYEEVLARLNRFLTLSREVLASAPREVSW